MHIRRLPTDCSPINHVVQTAWLMLLCAAPILTSPADAQDRHPGNLIVLAEPLVWNGSEDVLIENDHTSAEEKELDQPQEISSELLDSEPLDSDQPDELSNRPPQSPEAIADPPDVMEMDRFNASDLEWWKPHVKQSLLSQPSWIAFGLDQILIDTLEHSPRIQIVTSQASIALERVVQEDAAFDTSILFDSSVGRNNDPVGNTLTTGGPDRLIEENLTGTVGLRRRTRQGGELNLSQDLGLLDSNSTFFLPTNQGNSRLSLSLTQPLLGRRDQVYNERLLLQARIDSRVTWEEMKREVETRIVDVVSEYWRLHELRCHLKQNEELLKRGTAIEAFLKPRAVFDTGRLDLARVRTRIATRQRQQIVLTAEVQKTQSRLASLVGAEVLTSAAATMEMIPTESPEIPKVEWDLQSAVRQGLVNRPEIRSATSRLQSAALSMRVTKAELEPQLNARFDGYLAGLNGNNQAFSSLADQFTTGGPGISAGLRYERPLRGRAAKSRYREAQLQFRIRDQELQEVMDQSRTQIEVSLTDFQSAERARTAQLEVLRTALEEEQILEARWRALAADGATVAVALESLLDAQQRRTDAEHDLVTAQTGYVVALVELERAMGTLMKRSGIHPIQSAGNDIYFETQNHSTDEHSPIGQELSP